MTRDDIIRMAREASGHDFVGPRTIEFAERFAALVAAAEREKVAAWMRSKSYATGHGDTTEDLLKELEWQVAEREREACAKVCEETRFPDSYTAIRCAAAIRARGER